MDNSAELIARQTEIGNFIDEISVIYDVSILHEKCNKFIYSFPPELALYVAAYINLANPLYQPDIPNEQFAGLKISVDQFAGALLRTRMTVKRANSLNILVACAPKSASTFIQSALRESLDLPDVSLTAPVANSSELGANLREHEFDELALIRSGIDGRGFVAQHHMRMTPFAAAMIKLYNIQPIVTYRNILDTLVSMDDMFIADRAQSLDSNTSYFNDGLPQGYASLELNERLSILAHRHTAWLVSFYVSWKKCEAMGLVKPLWISYENDFLGDKKRLIARLLTHLGADRVDPEKMVKAFMDKSSGRSKRINKGVVGRGANVPEGIREFVKQVAKPYEDDVDLRPLIGPC